MEIKHIDWSDLEEMYYERKLSQKEIARRKGCTPQNVAKIMKARGIVKRSLKEQVRIYWRRDGKRRRWKRGPEHHCWKGGRRISNGYVKIYKPDHERADRDGYVFEHHLVWERYYGKIPKGYVIHHLNGVRSDNRIENLVALPRKHHHGRLIEQALKKRIRELEEKLKSLGAD